MKRNEKENKNKFRPQTSLFLIHVWSPNQPNLYGCGATKYFHTRSEIHTRDSRSNDPSSSARWDDGASAGTSIWSKWECGHQKRCAVIIFFLHWGSKLFTHPRLLTLPPLKEHGGKWGRHIYSILGTEKGRIKSSLRQWRMWYLANQSLARLIYGFYSGIPVRSFHPLEMQSPQGNRTSPAIKGWLMSVTGL